MKKLFLIIIIIGSIALISYGSYGKYEKSEKNKIEQKEKEKKEKQLQEIKNAFNQYVKSKTDSELYELDGTKYKKVGSVSTGYKLELEETEIKYDTKYFKIKNTDYYIDYKNVEKIDNIEEPDDRYKKYIVFNQNVVTKENSKFYRNDGTYISINKSFDFPIIEKFKDKYYFEYNNELLYVNSSDVSKTKKNKNTTTKTRKNIRVLTYHTVYDPKTQKCTNTVICHPISQFESHMKYLNENKYFTLTMKELEMFLDGNIRIPEKSIVISLDDGKYAINAVKIVEKYKVNATYFIITSKNEIPKTETTYMNFQSHTHNLHNNYKCPGGNQGGQLLCEKESVILEDLKKSKEIIGGDVFAFAYPFFDYNDRAIKLLKKAGFRLAFIGQANTDGYSDSTTDRFMLKRKTIFSYDSLQTFISRLV